MGSDRPALLGGTPVTRESLPRWPEVDESDVEAVVAHLRGGELAAYEVDSGPLFDFEAELRERFQTEYALLVGSGTAALQSAVYGLGLGEGDEIVVPAVTYPGTGAVPLHGGATVRFADIDPETGNPGLEHIRAAITDRTRAVVLAHAWGLPADLPSILPELEEREIALVEDAARAFGSRCLGRPVGSFGSAGCLSFNELKAVPGGEGGVFLTSNRRVYERAVALGHYFRCKVPLHLSLEGLVELHDSGLGLNLKIHPLAACLARSQLARFDQRLVEMEERHREFRAALKGLPGWSVQEAPSWAECVSYYGFNLHWRPPAGAPAPGLKTVIRALRADGVRASTAGSPPLFRLPLFRNPERSGLPGRVAGSLEDAAFPGAVEHVGSFVRLPTLFWDEPRWVSRYVEGLAKVSEHMVALHRWETEQADR